MLMTPCYTANFVAPEVLRKQGYDKACDIWSLGILLYTMLGGLPPFSASADDDPDRILRRIEEGSISFDGPHLAAVSSDVKALILGMLHRDPVRRLTIREVLGHAWLRVGSGAGTSFDLGPASASGDRIDVARVKLAVDNTFTAFNKPTAVKLAPVVKSSLASRRKKSIPSMKLDP